MKTIHRILALLLLCLNGVSCDILSADPPPFILSKPACVLGSQMDAQTYAGIHFTITNTSSKTMKKISIACMVYKNMEGGNPLKDSNNILGTFESPISPNQVKACILSLDKYLFTIPNDPYIIDHFYVSEVIFTDGTAWIDRFGIYAQNSY